ncbi:MAG TPA: hypothetical protein VGC54_13750, partial [Planctomycetota bacterium]
MTEPLQPPDAVPHGCNRRSFLSRAGGGFGLTALTGLLAADKLCAAPASAFLEGGDPLAPKDPHFAARAKSVIYLFLYGGPSAMDTF